MPQDTSAFDAALKDVYQAEVRQQLNEQTRALNLFTKGDIEQQEWEGRQVVIALRKSRNAGTKATAEAGLLPSAGKQGYANLKIPMRFLHGRIELTTQLIKAARSNKGSFVRAMDSEQKGLVGDLARQRNRIISYFGKGTLGIVSSVAGAVLTMKDPGGVAGTVNPTRFFFPDMVVAVHNGDSDTLRGVETITSVDRVNGTITLANAIAGAAANDIVTLGVKIGSTTEGSRNLEPMGLLGLVDSTTFVSSIFGLDRSLAANAFFRSQILSSVGPLSTDIIQRAIDNTEEVSGEVIDCFLCHVSARREYLKLLEADRRYTSEILRKPDGGTDAGSFKAELTYSDIPWKVDKDMAYGVILGLNKSHLFWIPEDEGSWADEDGDILHRVNDKDSYEARYRVFENFYSDRGNSHFRMDGVTVTVTSQVYAD